MVWLLLTLIVVNCVASVFAKTTGRGVLHIVVAILLGSLIGPLLVFHAMDAGWI
jgi:hypothetical protein